MINSMQSEDSLAFISESKCDLSSFSPKNFDKGGGNPKANFMVFCECFAGPCFLESIHGNKDSFAKDVWS